MLEMLFLSGMFLVNFISCIFQIFHSALLEPKKRVISVNF